MRAAERGHEIGADVIQIYGASPRMWAASVPSQKDAEEFKAALEENGIQAVYLHAAYLVNLASPSQEMYEKSVENLGKHLDIAEVLGAEGLIFHLGSGKDLLRKEALDREVRGIRRVLRERPGKAWLIMENSAGGGAKIGAEMEDIEYLFKNADSERVKICMDTAHAFEGGMIREYDSRNIGDLCDAWDKAVGLENLVALHVNDSKTLAGSHHDRHENIGEGHIGIRGFRALAKEKRLRDKAWIAEVPGFGGEGPDKRNLDIIKKLFS